MPGLSENLQMAPAWSFATSFTGTTLTHSSGATNTGSINVSSSVLTQLWPALKDQTTTLLLDGETPFEGRGFAAADWLAIVNTYKITNPE